MKKTFALLLALVMALQGKAITSRAASGAKRAPPEGGGVLSPARWEGAPAFTNLKGNREKN